MHRGGDILVVRVFNHFLRDRDPPMDVSRESRGREGTNPKIRRILQAIQAVGARVYGHAEGITEIFPFLAGLALMPNKNSGRFWKARARLAS